MAKIMNWPDFERKISQSRIVIFSPLDLKRLFGVSKTAISFFVHRYAKKGLLIKLKRGMYCLASRQPNEFYLANKLYEPSYISFEQALSYWQVIPETVYTLTCATTKATRSIKSLNRVFAYHRIKKEAFTGYKQQKIVGQTVLVAEPEKALADYLYFVVLKKKKRPDRYDKGKINKTKTIRLAKLFKNKELIDLIDEIL